MPKARNESSPAWSEAECRVSVTSAFQVPKGRMSLRVPCLIAGGLFREATHYRRVNSGSFPHFDVGNIKSQCRRHEVKVARHGALAECRVSVREGTQVPKGRMSLRVLCLIAGFFREPLEMPLQRTFVRFKFLRHSDLTPLQVQKRRLVQPNFPAQQGSGAVRDNELKN